MIKLQANDLAKELRMYIEFSLIPGDLAPAIVWLASRTTVELCLLAELHNIDGLLSASRMSLMKSILQCCCKGRN